MRSVWPGLDQERTMSFNLATILRESARSRPYKVALISGEHQMTYVELDRASDRFAAGLRDSGIAAGDVIGLQLPNVAQFAIAYFAILKTGAITVPVNVLYKADEVAFILRDCRAKMLITWAGAAEEAAKGAADAGVSDLVVLAGPGVPVPDAGR